MKEAKYARKNHVIYNVSEDGIDKENPLFTGKSINDAKRKSAELQKTEGGLGCGVLMTIN